MLLTDLTANDKEMKSNGEGKGREGAAEKVFVVPFAFRWWEGILVQGRLKADSKMTFPLLFL